MRSFRSPRQPRPALRSRIRVWHADALSGARGMPAAKESAEDIFSKVTPAGVDGRGQRRLRLSLLRERASGLAGAPGYDIRRHMSLAREMVLLNAASGRKQNGARTRTPS